MRQAPSQQTAYVDNPLNPHGTPDYWRDLPDFTSPAAFTIPENTTAIATLAATSTPTFAKSGGADAAKFTLTSDGILSFTSPPDFEAPGDANADNVYVVQVTATNRDGSTSQTISVTVSNVVEQTQIVVASSATFSIPENSTAVVGLTATGGNGTYTWIKTGGADVAKFNLTSGGVLSFVTPPDFEIPTDADTNNVYLVTVQAADGVNLPGSKALSVTVTNVAEFAATTFNPSDKTANVTLAAGNLQVGAIDNATGAVRTITSVAAGKFYFEVKWTNPGGGAGADGVGIGTATTPLSGGASLPGNATGGFVAFVGGAIFYNGSSQGISLGAFATNDVACIAIDLTNSRAWARKNGGLWNNSGAADPAANVGGVNIASLFPTNPAFCAVTKGGSAPVALANFGATAFAFTPPAGF